MAESKINKELVKDVASSEGVNPELLNELLTLAYSVSDITDFGARPQMVRDILKIISDAENEES